MRPKALAPILAKVLGLTSPEAVTVEAMSCLDDLAGLHLHDALTALHDAEANHGDDNYDDVRFRSRSFSRFSSILVGG